MVGVEPAMPAENSGGLRGGQWSGDVSTSPCNTRTLEVVVICNEVAHSQSLRGLVATENGTGPDALCMLLNFLLCYCRRVVQAGGGPRQVSRVVRGVTECDISRAFKIL